MSAKYRRQRKLIAIFILTTLMLLNMSLTLFEVRHIAAVVPADIPTDTVTPADDIPADPPADDVADPEPAITLVSAEITDKNKIHYTFSSAVTLDSATVFTVSDDTSTLAVLSASSVGSEADCGYIVLAEDLDLTKTYTLTVTNYGEVNVTVSPIFNTQDPENTPDISAIVDAAYREVISTCSGYSIFSSADSSSAKVPIANGIYTYRISLGDERALVIVNPTDTAQSYELLGEWYLILADDGSLSADPAPISGIVTISAGAQIALINNVALSENQSN